MRTWGIDSNHFHIRQVIPADNFFIGTCNFSRLHLCGSYDITKLWREVWGCSEFQRSFLPNQWRFSSYDWYLYMYICLEIYHTPATSCSFLFISFVRYCEYLLSWGAGKQPFRSWLWLCIYSFFYHINILGQHFRSHLYEFDEVWSVATASSVIWCSFLHWPVSLYLFATLVIVFLAT